MYNFNLKYFIIVTIESFRIDYLTPWLFDFSAITRSMFILSSCYVSMSLKILTKSWIGEEKIWNKYKVKQ